MNDTKIKILIDTLKKELKKNKVTYKSIAQNLDTSEITIKRIFSNHGCTLEKISKICSLIDLDLFELFDIAKKNIDNKYYYFNEKQEIYLSNNPVHLYFFREVYKGISINAICEELKLTKTDSIKILYQLEKLDLIEVHKYNKIKFLISGQLRPRLDGPIFKVILVKQNREFLDILHRNIQDPDCCFQTTELKITKTSYDCFKSELSNLGKKYWDISHTEENSLPEDQLINVRWLLGSLPYKANWKQ